MSKKILVITSALVTCLGYFFVKPTESFTGGYQLKKEPQVISKKAEAVLENKTVNKLADLSVQALQQQLKNLENDLKDEQFKNYSDFSKTELQVYNQKVRESVEIKKFLFLKKYAHWTSI